jgi:hypothetical protein
VLNAFHSATTVTTTAPNAFQQNKITTDKYLSHIIYMNLVEQMKKIQDEVLELFTRKMSLLQKVIMERTSLL